MDKYTVRSSDGSVDVSSSASAYTKALNEWVAQNEIPTDTIEAAVEAVFDRFPGQRLPMPALLSAAVTELNGSPSQFNVLNTRVHAYVKGQSVEGGRINVAKGKGGGVARLAKPGEEIPATPAK